MARSGTSLGMIIFALLALLLPESSQALDFSLKGRIQSELDANPFLREQGIRLQVVKEENGYVTIEMVEGDKKVREVIDKGVDVLGAGIDNQLLLVAETENALKTVNALKRSLAYVKKIDGVKEIQLVAVVNSRLDRAEELWRKGLEAEQQKDEPRAVRLYEQAQELGSILATVRLGGMYLSGRGVPKNSMRGIALIRRAAEQGDINGQFALASSYHQGIGVPEDKTMAATWLHKAAEQGHPQAQYLYGAMLAKGEGGLSKDKVQADAWFNRAISQVRKRADRGDSHSRYLLGCAYASGLAVVRDFGEAIKWLEKSNEPYAWHLLAWIFATCPEERYRDGRKAVAFAESALNKISSEEDTTSEQANIIGTLAAAYARNGQFDKAVTMQRKAIDLLLGETSGSGSEEKRLGKFRQRLDLYSNKQAFVATEDDD